MTAGIYRLRSRRTYLRRMTFLTRFGIAGGLIAGAFIGVPGIIESFTGKATATSFVLAYSAFFALPLLTALYLNQPRRDRLDDVGYALSVIGTGLFGAAAFTLDAVLVHLNRPAQQDLLRGSPRIALLLAVAVFIAGAVAFGASMIRAGTYPRVPAVAFPVVLPVFSISATLPYSPYKGVLHAALGAVLIWLALGLVRRMRSVAVAVAVAVEPDPAPAFRVSRPTAG
jgi:hypothetical protein